MPQYIYNVYKDSHKNAFLKLTKKIQKASMLRGLFQEMDKDGTGAVDREEFHLAMKTVDPTLSDTDIDVIFEAIDMDDNKEISFLEFVAATVDPREVDIQELNQAFRLLDRDGKGFITQEDLLRVMATEADVTVEDSVEDTAEQTGQKERSGGKLAPNGVTISGWGMSRSRCGSGTFDTDAQLLQQQQQQQQQQQHRNISERKLRQDRLNAKIFRIIEQADVNKDGTSSVLNELRTNNGLTAMLSS